MPIKLRSDIKSLKLNFNLDVRIDGHIFSSLSQNFKSCVYEATSKEDLVDGINAFMDQSLVVPTGQHWEEEVLMPFLRGIIFKQKEKTEKLIELRRKSMYVTIIQILVLKALIA